MRMVMNDGKVDHLLDMTERQIVGVANAATKVK